jgi:hypothetical protein
MMKNHCTIFYLAGLLAPMVLFAAGSAHAQYGCSDILKDGVRNTYKELRKGDLKTNFSNKYCASARKSQGSGSDANVGLDYKTMGESFGFSFGTSDKRTLQEASQNCGGTTSGLSDEKFETAMASVVDQSIVRAWQECMTRPVGLAITGRAEEKALSIYVFFRNAGSIGKTTTTSPPAISGATCPVDQLELIGKGAEINTGGTRLLCTRTGDGPVLMIVNSTFGPAELVMPREERIAETATPVEKKAGAGDKGPQIPPTYVCMGDMPPSAIPGAMAPRCITSLASDGAPCRCDIPGALGFQGRVVDLAKPIPAPRQ